MTQLTVIIERAEHNYAAYIKEIDGITTIGDSVADIKKKIKEAIQVFIEANEEFGYPIPAALQDEYKLVFELDARSFLDIYSGIFSKSGLERITGINQKQLWHYANGRTKPRPAQVKKLENALHNLGEELISLSL